MTRLARERGIVLLTFDLHETDKVAVVLGERSGKFSVLAKRARRVESPLGGILEATNRVELICYTLRKPYLLREASLLEWFPRLRDDPDALSTALGGLKEVAELCPEGNPEPGLYPLVLAFLRTLDGGADPPRVRLSFRLKAFSVMGHRPHLDGCLSCGGEEGITWVPEKGGLLCRACGGEGEEVPPAVWRGMRMLLRLPLWASGRVALREGEIQGAEGLLEEFRKAHFPVWSRESF